MGDKTDKKAICNDLRKAADTILRSIRPRFAHKKPTDLPDGYYWATPKGGRKRIIVRVSHIPHAEGDIAIAQNTGGDPEFLTGFRDYVGPIVEGENGSA